MQDLQGMVGQLGTANDILSNLMASIGSPSSDST